MVTPKRFIQAGIAAVAIVAVAACAVERVLDTDRSLTARASRQADIKARRDNAARIGHFHNMALEFVKNDIQGYVETGKHSNADEMAYAMESCTRFMRSQGSGYVCTFDPARLSAQVNLDPTRPLAPRSDLSQMAQSYLASIQSAADAATTASGFAAAAASITSEAEGVLVGDDLSAVLNAEAVGDSSFTYWENNNETYVTTYVDVHHIQQQYTMTIDPMYGNEPRNSVHAPDTGALRYGWFSWKKVAAYDVGGCIGASIPSAGALCGEGAAGASIIEAVAQILLHYSGE